MEVEDAPLLSPAAGFSPLSTEQWTSRSMDFFSSGAAGSSPPTRRATPSSTTATCTPSAPFRGRERPLRPGHGASGTGTRPSRPSSGPRPGPATTSTTTGHAALSLRLHGRLRPLSRRAVLVRGGRQRQERLGVRGGRRHLLLRRSARRVEQGAKEGDWALPFGGLTVHVLSAGGRRCWPKPKKKLDPLGSSGGAT